MTTATVLSGPERRRRWSAAEKLQIVEESLAPEKRVTEVARRHDVHANLLHAWRRQVRTGGFRRRRPNEPRFVPVAITTDTGVVTSGGAGRDADNRGGAAQRPGAAFAEGRCPDASRSAGQRAGADIIPIPSGARVSLATGHTDMRNYAERTIMLSPRRRTRGRRG